jgi:hypothetical protein
MHEAQVHQAELCQAILAITVLVKLSDDSIDVYSCTAHVISLINYCSSLLLQQLVASDICMLEC